ncbi:MAG: hypothetical protein R3304_06015 [Longimicrobiales bacterium]|nr:hypothetical protein [Longimicrobiales bacterium]
MELALDCPNCAAGMEHLALEGVYAAALEIDLCFACHVLWFDKRESIHLTASGVLELFRVLHEHREDPRHALDRRSRCPRCQRRLSIRHDIGKGGRFSYYACPSGHGRLTPFSEFLKEKEFVRELNAAERHRLRVEVKEVQCSRCGAPVEVGGSFACDHCGSPLTVLDAEAVERTLRALSAEREQESGNPEDDEMRARALASMEAMRSRGDDPFGRFGPGVRRRDGLSPFDLLTASIGFLFGDS